MRIRQYSLWCHLLLAALICWSSTIATAQDAQNSWQDAVKLIDSNSPADIVAAISKLQASAQAKSPMMPLEGWASLAICQLRQSDTENARQTLERINTLFPAVMQVEHRCLLLRLKLYAALTLEDAAQAEAAYKDLVRSLAIEQGDAVDMKLTAQSIGATFAMLDLPRAKSPIPASVLQIGSQHTQNVKTRGVAGGYQFAYETANERASAIAANMLAIEQQGLDVITQEFDKRSAALKAKLAEVAQQKELNKEVVRNSREQLDQIKLDLRQLARDITAINFKLKQPTPGHPGLKRNPPPPPPSRRSINVEEYEIRTEYEYIPQNGEQVRVPVTRQVRRPQYEIDRDRDRVYNRIRDDYDRVMRDYRDYEAQYTESLRSWSATHQQRLKELTNQLGDAEAKRDQLVEASKSINVDKKESAKDLRLKRTAQEQEAFELSMLEIALEAVQAGQPHRAFRPVNFELLTWSQEKVLLQRN